MNVLIKYRKPKTDVELLKKLGNRRLDVTIGSALDIFGGTIPFEKAADIS